MSLRQIEEQHTEARPEQRRGALVWAAREHHRFEAAGKPLVYLVPSAAIFALDDRADAVLRRLRDRPHTSEELRASCNEDPDLADTVAELARVRAIGVV